MKTHPHLLSSSEDIRGLANRLKEQSMIAVDTEFIRETTFYPIIEIIQVATREESWVVDAQFFKKNYAPGPKGSFDSGIQPLLEVFENPRILKVIHAAQGDQECLYTSFGIFAKPVLDTSVAAALCGYGESMGLGNLLKHVLGVTIKKGHARTNWSERPLPSQLMEYAHADVEHLVELGISLISKLEDLQRKDWALTISEKSADPSLYDPEPVAVASRISRGGRLDKRGYAALVELLKWREKRVRESNLPRRWVADDAVLIDLANVRPKTLEHLSSFRGLNKGILKSCGEEILAALQKHAEGHKPPEVKRPEVPNSKEAQVLELLKCYIGILADEYEISPRFLMNNSLLSLLRSDFKTPDALIAAGILTPEAATLVGQKILDFIHGKIALKVDQNQIIRIEK